MTLHRYAERRVPRSSMFHLLSKSEQSATPEATWYQMYQIKREIIPKGKLVRAVFLPMKSFCICTESNLYSKPGELCKLAKTFFIICRFYIHTHT